jgi:hypothetical protein
MPDLRMYQLFISHAWEYDADYHQLVGLLNAAPNFFWKNFSVPEHDPVLDPSKSTDHEKLFRALETQIRSASCVLVIAGVYVAHRHWIQIEIDIAQALYKPIVGLNPHGSQRRSTEVQDAALEMVSWSTGSIVAAIRRHAL